MLEEQFKAYFHEQKRSADPRRLEMLNRNLTAEIKLLKEVLWPVFGSTDGLEMEYELISLTGPINHNHNLLRNISAIPSHSFLEEASNSCRLVSKY
ncbi:hypothetical protein KCTCHS21_54890 [Cohnella abietis]|uniref:Uncharacterized protein n=2 Tax=Cohnella abietis TaxID=2507935 RepID=A0A3T1DD86_9BACL|nr:hypothetical protein KCTCHS21_54890 [Cohnella abietis]